MSRHREPSPRTRRLGASLYYQKSKNKKVTRGSRRLTRVRSLPAEKNGDAAGLTQQPLIAPETRSFLVRAGPRVADAASLRSMIFTALRGLFGKTGVGQRWETWDVVAFNAATSKGLVRARGTDWLGFRAALALLAHYRGEACRLEILEESETDTDLEVLGSE